MKLDRSKLKRTKLAARKSLVSVRDFVRLTGVDQSLADFIEGLPNILGGTDLRRLAGVIVTARKAQKPVVAAVGAHVIKCGLTPVLIDLMKRGFVTAVATNGACAIHDFEIARAGKTSEDVAAGLSDGSYGMTEETAVALAEAGHQAGQNDSGLGHALGERILAVGGKYTELSLFAAAHELGIPCTCHVAIGTDTAHFHPEVDCAELAAASFRDFEIIAEVVSELSGGVWMNIGSAVILPEIFLKAVALCRNLGRKLTRLTCANLDMIQHYRPRINVTGRPAAVGITLTGQHEFLLPLLRAAVLVEAGKRG